MPPDRRPRPSCEESSFAVLTWADWTLLGTLTTFLVILCVVRSHGRLLWADELLGDRLLNRTSFAGMMRGWWEGADGGGPCYYLLGRVWVDAVGHTALSLRLFSTLGMAAGIVFLWTAARSRFSTVSVAWSIGLTCLYASGPRWQEVNGRFYGLFFASAALASFMFLRTAVCETTRLDLVLNGTANILLVGSHVLGFVYSFGLLTGMVLLDRILGRRRWKLYLSFMSGWIVLAMAAHAIYRSTSIAKNMFWTVKPGRYEAFVGLAVYSSVLFKLLLALMLLATLKLLLQRRFLGFLQSLTRDPVMWLCASLMLAQFVLFTKSRLGISIYADRYLLPLVTLTVLVYAACFDQLFTVFRNSALKARGLGFALLGLLPSAAVALRQPDLTQLYPKAGLPERMTAHIPQGASVLVTLLPDFTLMNRYDPSRHYYFLLDWPYDLAPSRVNRFDYSGQREMENWRRAGLLTDRILECPQVFERNSTLYLFLDPGRQQWMQDHLLHNPDFTVEQVGTWSEWEPYSLWLVRRSHPGPAPC